MMRATPVYNSNAVFPLKMTFKSEFMNFHLIIFHNFSNGAGRKDQLQELSKYITVCERQTD